MKKLVIIGLVFCFLAFHSYANNPEVELSVDKITGKDAVLLNALLPQIDTATTYDKECIGTYTINDIADQFAYEDEDKTRLCGVFCVCGDSIGTKCICTFKGEMVDENMPTIYGNIFRNIGSLDSSKIREGRYAIDVIAKDGSITTTINIGEALTFEKIVPEDGTPSYSISLLGQ